jgi:hypothetical protein
LKGRIAGVIIAWVVVLVVGWRGLVPGGWIRERLYPRPHRAPASEVRMGIRVTAEGLHAARIPDTDTAQMDLLFSVERLDGGDWPDDPLLRVSLLVQGREYAPTFQGAFRAGGRPPFETRVRIRPAGRGVGHGDEDRAAPRRYLCRFRGLPRLWLDGSLVVRLVREIPKPDFDLGTLRLGSGEQAAETLIRDGTVVRLRGLYQGPLPYDPKGGIVTRLDVREELPIRYGSGVMRLTYPGYGRLVVDDDRGERLQGVRSYPRGPSIWGLGAGTLYVLQLPPEARQPRSMHAEFISTDAMAGDSIEFVVPRLTTLNGV